MSKYIIRIIRIMWRAGQSWHENKKSGIGSIQGNISELR